MQLVQLCGWGRPSCRSTANRTCLILYENINFQKLWSLMWCSGSCDYLSFVVNFRSVPGLKNSRKNI